MVDSGVVADARRKYLHLRSGGSLSGHGDAERISEYVQEMEKADQEIERLRRALALIANGNIAPSQRFAERVLYGMEPSEALRMEKR